MELKQIIQLLKLDKIGVMLTDTIYGILGSALNPKVVEEVYRLRKRSKDKPMIILISSIDDLKKFDIQINLEQRKFLEKNWPNPVSVVLPCVSPDFEYLHRGKKSLAFRMPKNKKLLEILKAVGPLVAPSANFEGEKFAESIAAAKKYFGNQVAFYLDEGVINSAPSTLVEFKQDFVNILRQGIFKVIT